MTDNDGECQWHWSIRNLAENLRWAAALCRAHDSTHRNTRAWEHGDEILWRPGCGTPAP